MSAATNDQIMNLLTIVNARMGAIEARLAALEDRQANMEANMATQADIDALAQQVSDEAATISQAQQTIEGHVADLGTAEQAIQTEIQQLQAAATAGGVTLDFTGLQNNVSTLTAAGQGIAQAASDLGGAVSTVQGLAPTTPPTGA